MNNLKNKRLRERQCRQLLKECLDPKKDFLEQTRCLFLNRLSERCGKFIKAEKRPIIAKKTRR